MVRKKLGELQIQYDSMKGRIYVRILEKNKCVDVVATSEHITAAEEILGEADAEDSKGYPLWRSISAFDLARLIEPEAEEDDSDNDIYKEILQEIGQQAMESVVGQSDDKKMSEADVQFDRTLKELPEGARPFVSYGNPLVSDVLIVGFNPATGGDIQWKEYWEPPIFHGDRWRNEVYLALRDKSPSPTWRNMKRLEDSATDLTFTETNVFSMHSPDASSLDHFDTTAFDALLKHSNPRLIIPHGKDAIEYLAKALKISLMLPERSDLIGEYVELEGFDVLPVWHLSRLWSNARLDALGEELNKRYAGDR